MAVTRCSKGHYYDDTKFAQCPHCGVLPAVEPEKPAKMKRFGFFRKEAPAKEPTGPVMPAGPDPVPSPVSGGQPSAGEYDDRTVGLSQMPGAGSYGDDDRTIAFGQPSGGNGYGDDDNRTIAFGAGGAGGSYGDDDNRTIAFGAGVAGGSYGDDDNRTIAFGRNAVGGSGGSGIDEDDNRTIAFGRNAVGGSGGSGIDEDDNRTIAFGRNAVGGSGGSSIDEDDNRTIAFGRNAVGGSGGSGIDEDDNRTIAFSRPPEKNLGSSRPVKPAGEAKPPVPAPSVKVQPVSGAVPEETFPLSPEQYVAGWLVCVKGDWKGKDYRLYKGFNRMGSQGNVDIPLPKELTDTVCSLVYDDRGNSFYLVQQSGDPVYLNESVVKGSTKVQTGDRIKAGEAEFEFIAFCREGRAWDI